MCSFRAVENRRYVARAANTGISAFISPDGQIYKQTKIFTDDSLTAMIYKRTDKTFYSLYGDIFAFICTFLSLLFIYMARRKKSKNTWYYFIWQLNKAPRKEKIMPSQWKENISLLEKRMETIRGYLWTASKKWPAERAWKACLWSRLLEKQRWSKKNNKRAKDNWKRPQPVETSWKNPWRRPGPSWTCRWRNWRRPGHRIRA